MLLVALLAALVTPGLAVAHGLAHAHEASEHRAEHDHDPAGAVHGVDSTVSTPDHKHEHGHAVVDVAPGTRELARVDLAPVVAEPPAVPVATDRSLAHAPAIADHALLARLDPESGPPPRFRAPPPR
jgi:hypothetical protein